MHSHIFILLPLVLCFAERQLIPHHVPPDSDQMIDFINTFKTTWTAGRNFRPGVGMEELRGLTGVILSTSDYKLPVKQVAVPKNLPLAFDARDRWPECPSIREVRDQGNCGSCWAVAVAEVISDRICIASHGHVTTDVSAEDLLSCCGDDCGHGCDGGRPHDAWKYWFRHGLVTGGLYNGTGCEPYTIPPCDHHVPGQWPTCGAPLSPTPPCARHCVISYNKSYEADKIYARRIYSIETEEQTMTEILTKGPVQADFNLMSDFFSYKRGVYQSLSKRRVNGHAIKLIGWGEESGTKYWIAANSWNTNWGDGGFFKILRGMNESGVESFVHAGDAII